MAWYYAGGKARTGFYKKIGTFPASSSNTYDCTRLLDEFGLEKDEIVASNFIIEPKNNSASGYNSGDVPTGGFSGDVTIAVDGSDSFGITKSYNQSNGILTFNCVCSESNRTHNPSRSGSVGSDATNYCEIDLYFYYKED